MGSKQGEEGRKEEEDEDDDDDGIDKWRTPQVAGAGVAGLVLGGLGVVGAGKLWKSSPEKRLTIVTAVSIDKLTADEKTKLDNDDKVEYATGNQIISTYKTLKAFTDAHPGFTGNNVPGETVKGTYVKCGETLLRSTADNKWEVLTTANVEEESDNEESDEETETEKAARLEKEKAEKLKADKEAEAEADKKKKE